ncbi:MAG: transcription termination factor Rho [Clostridia bacterium]|nr:transcription termination factor Rho [Clostridia bacterium]
MSKLKTLTVDILEPLHLSILRELGRFIGVKSPASKVKEVLIEEILAIQSGKMEPAERNKKGAPTKLAVDLSMFFEENEEDFIEEPNSGKIIFADEEGEERVIEGILEPHSNYAFLRTKGYESSEKDVFVSGPIIRKYNLKKGDLVKGKAKAVREEGYPALQTVITVNDKKAIEYPDRVDFESLLACYPTEKINLEIIKNPDISCRAIDLFAPIGKGQRGLVVAPPKTGKTTLIKKIAKSIEENHKEIELIILLIDERPEEVTDIKRSVKSTVVYSTFDQSVDHHIRASELVISRAKRLVENGKDVVILLDSITRLARAYNNYIEPSGRTLSGGLDPTALSGPKRFFGSARNVEDGGSLTIIATALVETGSRMDDIIFEEFKGTGNMELHLSRELAERRIFPAIDLNKSGTRKEELLLSEEELLVSTKLRKLLYSNEKVSVDALFEMMEKSSCNADLISKIDEWINIYKSTL